MGRSPEGELATFCKLYLHMPCSEEGAGAMKDWRDGLVACSAREDLYLRFAAIFWYDGHPAEAMEYLALWKSQLPFRR